MPFEAELQKVARDYTSWGRVDDLLRWAPTDCALPPPARLRESRAGGSAGHGRKLYSLFARDRDAYVAGRSVDGQIVVKEAWLPERTPPGDTLSAHQPKGPSSSSNDYFVPYAVGPDGGLLHAKRRAGLFIMLKEDPATSGTDDGWVYGTISPDGEVTASGRVASCMGCHQRAPQGRLFGVHPAD